MVHIFVFLWRRSINVTLSSFNLIDLKGETVVFLPVFFQQHLDVFLWGGGYFALPRCVC